MSLDNKQQTYSPTELEALLIKTGAILKGHFKLTSGRHSDTYVEKFRIIELADVLSIICSQIAKRFEKEKIDIVAGPATGGMIIAFEVARQLGIPARYIETENGIKTFRRGATFPEGSRVLVVDDVLTTGLSLFESAAAVKHLNGTVIGYGVLISRNLEFASDVPLYAALALDIKSYAPEEVPGWLMDIPITKPGTRAT